MLLLIYADVGNFFYDIWQDILDLFQYSSNIMSALLNGTLITIQIFCLTLILALPLGLIISLCVISKFKPLRFIAKTYIWIFRGTPLMLQLFFFYFFLPYIGITLTDFGSAIVAFVLNYAAYFAEIYRSGIQSIEKGQYEAAKTLGFTPWQTMQHVIIPQTIKRIIPPISNETITLIKDTSLVYVLSISELMKAARSAANRDTVATPFFIAALIYLLLTFILTFISNKLEKKFSYYEAETVENNSKRKSHIFGRRTSE